MGSEVTGREVCDWIEEFCRIPDGELVGQPVQLTPPQKEWICEIYDSPTRLFILSMARKNAKTALIAFLLLVHLCGPAARRNSQLYSAAQSKEQASLVYEYAAKCVRLSPDLEAVTKLRDTAKEILCPDLGTFYKALSAEATTSFGKNPVFLVHDELGQVKGPRSPLFEALETATGAQKSPLSLIISTQAPTDADLLSVLIDDAKSGADPTKKVVLHSAPEDADPFSEEAIRLANPHFDHFMNKEEVLRQAADAKRMPSREADYRNLILNQRVEASTPFVAQSIWKSNGGDAEISPGDPVYIGFDLSESCDLTAMVMVTPSGVVKPTFWLPEEGIEARSRGDRVPYDMWAKQGFLDLTPGKTIEYEFVAYFMRQVFDTYDVRAVAFDRYNYRHFKPWLQKNGFSEHELDGPERVFKEFGQGFVSMAPAIRELEARLVGAKLSHGNHPVLTMCAANAVIASDPAGNRKFNKAKSTGRIDGIVALAMAVAVMAEEEVDSMDMDAFLADPLVF